MNAITLASIPSPGNGVWHIGDFPIRGYALCIILGVIVAVWVGDRRWVQRGGSPGMVGDVAVWAVPFGLVGGRLYHVLTDPELYFGEGKSAITALYIWRGGLGIWGAIALGALGAYIGCRRNGCRFGAFADALAPGIVLAQAVGRWGNWFNQELYGKPTDLPWGLEIDPAHRGDYQQYTTFHPTFLYESHLGRRRRRARHLARPQAASSATAGRSRCTSWRTPPAAAGSSTCASTPPTTSSASGSTSGRRSCCSCSPRRTS